MATTEQNLKRILHSVFGIDFSCVSSSAGNRGFTISPLELNNPTGFSIKVTRPYPDSCKASVIFGTFSRNLIERWFKEPDNLNEAFEFVRGISDEITIDIQVAGKKVSSAEEFAAEHNSNWASTGVSARFAFRGYDKKEADSRVVLITIAALGFTLLASGFAVKNSNQGEVEGETSISTTTRYERSRINRARCLAHHGTKCFACGFDFGEAYGSFANGYIEVHHIVPVSQMDSAMRIDPIHDLVPLCPNCHAAVHMTNPPIHPETLRDLIKSNRSEQ